MSHAVGLLEVLVKVRTPTPVLAEVRDSTPAAPAINATINDHLFGE